MLWIPLVKSNTSILLLQLCVSCWFYLLSICKVFYVLKFVSSLAHSIVSWVFCCNQAGRIFISSILCFVLHPLEEMFLLPHFLCSNNTSLIMKIQQFKHNIQLNGYLVVYVVANIQMQPKKSNLAALGLASFAIGTDQLLYW